MPDQNEIINNRQAYHEFIITDKFEAGAVLQGTEVKSIMAGRIQPILDALLAAGSIA